MVSETIQDRIPCRTVCRDQNLFGQTDPYWIKNQPTALKVEKAKIIGDPNRFRMFA